MAQEFKVGDRVLALCDHDGAATRNLRGIVKQFRYGSALVSFDARPDGANDSYESQGGWWMSNGQLTRLTDQPIKEKTTIMSNLVKRVKALTLSKDDKVLRNQGFTNEDGSLTIEGSEVLDDLVYADYKAKLVEKAQALEAEDKASKKA